MSYRRMIWASAVVAAGMAGVAAVALGRLPAGTQLPTHWNAAGEGDRLADASTALFMPVLLTIALAAVFAAVPRLEPVQHRLDRSAPLLTTAWGALLGVMAVVEALVAAPAWGLHLPGTLGMAAAGLMLIAVGNQLPKSRPGFFVGIRTPWAIMDQDNWIATHRLGAWTFMTGGALIVGAAVLPLPAQVRTALVIAALVVATVPPVLYSFLHWRRSQAHA